MSMPAPKLVGEIPLDSVDLEALDDFLISERAPPDSMMLSDLDGFLTGIAVGPELILPSEWLPLVWGGEAPEFADEAEAKTIPGTIFGRYNEILRRIGDDSLDPVFWDDRDGKPIAADWAAGFMQAMALRAPEWERLLKSKRDHELLLPILALCGDENGDSLLGLTPDEERIAMEEAPEFIPGCVIAIAAYWRAKKRRKIPIPLVAGPPPQPQRASTKVGRNDPCPCRSGVKFKKCCGEAA